MNLNFITFNVNSQLNPYAIPWNNHEEHRLSEDDRSLFITFSRGLPIPEIDIYNFFSWKYGNCIEYIYIHRPNNSSPPLFGKIVFKLCVTLYAIMGLEQEVRFRISSKSLWCKRYKKRVITHLW
ncbi:hypothetical protein RND81_02G133400 [Saponaria officinalis]|uniref:Uncharacterized protein n=1 Tax=Saponaria officinalis TaxID=3572 RepID=A0AAW1MWP8_SAPOF